jgi:hypothetical protein
MNAGSTPQKKKISHETKKAGARSKNLERIPALIVQTSLLTYSRLSTDQFTHLGQRTIHQAPLYPPFRKTQNHHAEQACKYTII